MHSSENSPSIVKSAGPGVSSFSGRGLEASGYGIALDPLSQRLKASSRRSYHLTWIPLKFGGANHFLFCALLNKQAGWGSSILSYSLPFRCTSLLIPEAHLIPYLWHRKWCLGFQWLGVCCLIWNSLCVSSWSSRIQHNTVTGFKLRAD